MRWLPSGLILYSENPRAGQEDVYQLFVARPGGKARAVTPMLFADSDQSLISADGRHLFLSRLVYKHRVKRRVNSVVDLASGKQKALRRLTTDTDAPRCVFRLPDGHLAFVADRGGRERIVSFSVDGQARRTLMTL